MSGYTADGLSSRSRRRAITDVAGRGADSTSACWDGRRRGRGARGGNAIERSFDVMRAPGLEAELNTAPPSPYERSTDPINLEPADPRRRVDVDVRSRARPRTGSPSTGTSVDDVREWSRPSYATRGRLGPAPEDRYAVWPWEGYEARRVTALPTLAARSRAAQESRRSWSPRPGSHGRRRARCRPGASAGCSSDRTPKAPMGGRTGLAFDGGGRARSWHRSSGLVRLSGSSGARAPARGVRPSLGEGVAGSRSHTDDVSRRPGDSRGFSRTTSTPTYFVERRTTWTCLGFDRMKSATSVCEPLRPVRRPTSDVFVPLSASRARSP